VPKRRFRRFALFVALGVGFALSLGLAAAWLAGRSLNHPSASPAPSNGIFRTLAGAAAFRSGVMEGLAVDSSGALVLDATGRLGAGTDTAGVYNGGSYVFGTFVSPVFPSAVPVDEVVASWAADTPDGTWVEVKAAALVDAAWTKDYSLGVWASGTAVVKRHNSGRQADGAGWVDTDTLRLSRPASAVRLSATLFSVDPGLTPRLRRLSVVATGSSPVGDAGGAPAPYRRAWGVDLAVPERRQNDFPDGAGWCSPTSLSMLMAFWARRTGTVAWDRSVPETAAGVTDYAYGGTGNWAFNTAYAAALGLDAYVTRFGSLADVERWIAAGVPVAINIEFGPGQLTGAPMPSTDGHVIVIRGFDRKGDPIANDPASRADQGESVRIVYDRAQLEKAWQGRPRGTAYIIYPPGYPTP